MLQILELCETYHLEFHMMFVMRSQLVLTIDATILGNGSVMAVGAFV